MPSVHWPILTICANPDRCNRLWESLSAIDRRVSVEAAADLAEALRIVEATNPLLATVSLPHSFAQTLRTIDAVRRRAPCLPLIAEVPGEHPMMALQALRLGATDCLKQPVAPWEWQNRCRAVIEAERRRRLLVSALRRAGRRLLHHREPLPLTPVLKLLARADTFHDAVTGAHDRRAGKLAGLIAAGLGLPPEQSRIIEDGATLHDIGKLGIPDDLLTKPGRFTDADREVMRAHPRIGHEILRSGDSPTLRMGAEVALSHHERIDGSGYPTGLEGEAIPLPGRIVAVADVFDSLVAGRPYRKPISVQEGLAYLTSQSGRLFDPLCIDALRSASAAAEKIVATTASGEPISRH
jgi:two-component system response regulator RpfG